MNAAMDVPAMRMLRRGPWKLVHYDGYDAPQLFNLAEDPRELHDLGTDPSAAGNREELRAAALAGWSAAAMEAALARRARDREVMVAWNRQVRLAEPAHWTVDPAYNIFPDEAPSRD
jgi:arylsulfatase A-like enzyme